MILLVVPTLIILRSYDSVALTGLGQGVRTAPSPGITARPTASPARPRGALRLGCTRDRAGARSPPGSGSRQGGGSAHGEGGRLPWRLLPSDGCQAPVAEVPVAMVTRVPPLPAPLRRIRSAGPGVVLGWDAVTSPPRAAAANGSAGVRRGRAGPQGRGRHRPHRHRHRQRYR